MPPKDNEEDPYSERPPDSDFQQQNLKAWQPLLTPLTVIGTFFFIGALFVPIGVVVLNASQSVVEYTIPYGDVHNETKTFNIEQDMAQPVYFYYKLENFYQNHRRYVKSRSDEQLRGEPDAETSKCTPLEKNSAGEVYYPCGLIAGSYFNDKFELARNSTFKWTDEGIAWPSDRDKKFKYYNYVNDSDVSYTNIGQNGKRLPDVEDEAFMVWMRTAGLPTFKKLRYIIKSDLKKGDKLRISVESNFNVSDFDGKKYLVISTVSWLGGKNDFLGYAYIAVGGVCIFLALAFTIKQRVSPRTLGDMKYFNFKNQNQGK